MSELFSEEALKSLHDAHVRNRRWDKELAELAGKHFAGLVEGELRRSQPTCTLFVGVGVLGCQLAKATIDHLGDRPLPRHLVRAQLSKSSGIQLVQPPVRGHAVIVSGAMLPEEQLSSLTHQIRSGRATLADMLVVAGDAWPPDGQPQAARDYGVTVHPLAPYVDER